MPTHLENRIAKHRSYWPENCPDELSMRECHACQWLLVYGDKPESHEQTSAECNEQPQPESYEQTSAECNEQLLLEHGEQTWGICNEIFSTKCRECIAREVILNSNFVEFLDGTRFVVKTRSQRRRNNAKVNRRIEGIV
jgi:hypothetical protein